MSKPVPVRRRMCKTCIFRPDSKLLRPGRLAAIKEGLVRGVNQFCHEERGPRGGQARVACRGGRDWLLMIWHRLGIIKKPTDHSLADTMEACGFAAWRPPTRPE